jgi:transitional endoplasmic reticulum ATPase
MNGNDGNIDRELDEIFPTGGGTVPTGAGRQMLAQLFALSAGTPIVTGDEIEYHDGQKVVLPKGWTYEKAIQVLNRLHEESETVTAFERRYPYRTDDGAVATSTVLNRRYGMPVGETVDMGFFKVPPRLRTVLVDHDQKVQVPWGKLSLPALPGIELTLCEGYEEDSTGSLFHIHVTAAKKHKATIDEIFDEIDQELRTNSIYRGKALSGSHKLEFQNYDGFNADEIVFSEAATEALEAGVWAPLRYTEAFRQEGLRLKRAALLYGPYGTGKSSAGVITAQIAIANGWTFLSAKPGEDNIRQVLETAKLYQPAVVFIEDADTQTSTSDDGAVSELLDIFDGITAKGGELMILMTTNHPDRIHKGMFRPGRMDTVIEINELDRTSVERLIRATVPAGKLDETVDFEQVYAAMDGFYPAFVREAVERAKSFAVSRAKGVRTYTLSTDDLVKAARSLHPQLAQLKAASEGLAKPVLETVLSTAFEEAAQRAVHGTKLKFNYGGGDDGTLSVPALNGQAH